MRPLSKPRPQKWAQSSATVTYMALLQALIETIGEYCSFCEKPLRNTASLFHKVRGDVKESKLSVSEWESLLLICSDCKRYKQPVNPNISYLWPDDSTNLTFSLDAKTRPFSYVKMTATVQKLDAKQSVVENGSQDFVFVVVNTNLDTTIQRQAQATIDLFQLNSPYFKMSGNQAILAIPQEIPKVPTPDLTYVPWGDLVSAVDARLIGRQAAYTGAQEALRLLAAVLKIKDFKNMDSFVATAMNNVLPQIAIRLSWTGYWSTWVTFMQPALQDDALINRLFWGPQPALISGGKAPDNTLIFSLAGTRIPLTMRPPEAG